VTVSIQIKETERKQQQQ